MNSIDQLWILFQTLTFAKVLNSIKLFLSFWVSKYSGKSWMWGLPMSLSIEPTTACNLGCTECPSGLKSFTRDTGNLKAHLLLKTLDELKGTLSYVSFYFQGEPYINPSFLSFVKEATNRNIYTITSTNAHFISKEVAGQTVESGLHKLIVSLDGTTQETYEKYRVHGSIDKVLTGIKNVAEAKEKLKRSTPIIEIQYLVTSYNEHQIEEAKALTKEVGADNIVFKTIQVYNFENGNDLLPKNDAYSRYSKEPSGKYALKNSLDNQCWKMWNSNVVTWDGKIVPCCFDKDAKYELGNVNRSSVAEIWRSEPYTKFRKNILMSRKEIDICTNCSEGTTIFKKI